MINKVIKKSKAQVLAELCQKVVAKKWSEKMVKEVPMLIKAIDIEQLKAEILKETEKARFVGNDNEAKVKKLKEDKEMYDIYQQDLRDIRINEQSIQADVFAYKVLCDSVKEITNLIK